MKSKLGLSKRVTRSAAAPFAAALLLATGCSETASVVGASDAGATSPSADAGADAGPGAPFDGDERGEPDEPLPDEGADAGTMADGGKPPPVGSPVQTPADCDAAHPTWLGGDIVGSDGRALNAIIGIDHLDANGTRIDANGVVCGTPGSVCCGGYSWCSRVNPAIDPAGSTDPALVRKWGKCITSKVTIAFFEVYPKNASGVTTQTRYGEAVHQYQPITPSTPNSILLRLPVTHEADANGNTGTVAGKVTCAGNPVPPADITRVRAWSNGRGPDCGIEGFNASATSLAIVGGTTRYEIAHLAGGRCNAPSQNYRFYMDVTCGGIKKSMRLDRDIVQAQTTALDWAF